MLFSCRNRAQIEQVRDKLASSGIRCEIRDFPVDTQECGARVYPELWVQANPDYHTASILYASPVRLLRERAHGKMAG